MRIAPEATEQDTGSARAAWCGRSRRCTNFVELRPVRQLAIQDQVGDLEERAVLGQLLDRVAAMQQDALVAVDVGDLGAAARGRGEAGIVGEHPGLAIELADVDDVRAERALEDREVRLGRLAGGERRGLGLA